MSSESTATNDSNNHSDLTPSVVDGTDRALLREAVRRAVDFRGDVTIHTRAGVAILGYAFDAQLDGANECIRVLPPDSNTRTTVLLADIRTLAFTGKDAASGKSFENWIRRYAAKKIAGEVASIESEVL